MKGRSSKLKAELLREKKEEYNEYQNFMYDD